MAAGCFLVIGRRFSASRFWQTVVETGTPQVNLLMAMTTILTRRSRSEFIAGHPAVSEVAAIPAPSELGEDEIMAVVVYKPSAQMKETEVRDGCAERLAAYKMPRFVVFVDELPHIATYKVARFSWRCGATRRCASGRRTLRRPCIDAGMGASGSSVSPGTLASSIHATFLQKSEQRIV